MSNGNGHRWSKFWWCDWQNDAALRMCSLGAQGYWMRALCLMHEADPIGHLTVNGRIPTTRQLSAITGATEKDVTLYTHELEENGVFSRLPDGTIYCRRMVRDAAAETNGREEVAARWGGSDGKSRSQRLREARSKGTHTPQQFHAMCEVFGFRCVRCGQEGDILRDHIVPIYQGGDDSLNNLQPLCSKCNRSKGPDNTDHRDAARADWRNVLDDALKRLDPLDVKTSPPRRQTSTRSLEAELREDPPRSPPRGAARRPKFRNAAHELAREMDAQQPITIDGTLEKPQQIVDFLEFVEARPKQAGGASG